MNTTKSYDVELRNQVDGVVPSSATFALDRNKALEIVRLSVLVKASNLHKVEKLDRTVDYQADFEIDGETLNVSSRDFWFAGHAKSSGAPFETEQLSIAELAQFFGVTVEDAREPFQVFHGATKEEIRSVMMQDIVGDYDIPDEVSEWKWVEEKASFVHSRNGQDGVWEFVLNLANSWDDIPEKLVPVISSARADHAGYLIIHQGT
jgi:hypothetical protein